MSDDPVMATDWRVLIARGIIVLIIPVSGYLSFQIAKDASLQHWLRLVLVYYSLFTALAGLGVLAVIIWKLSRMIGPRHDWWTLP